MVTEKMGEGRDKQDPNLMDLDLGELSWAVGMGE